ncbi:MAG TPA: Na+/H+ antiporter subunit E [Terriglobales bacterium]|nr:Na+/H+ antiporter subunit E [Terriglobales bacterium]
MPRALKIGLSSGIIWLILLVLWFLFVSQWKKDELLVGVVVAATAALANMVVEAQGFARFRPKLSWLMLIWWQPWYAIDGTWATLKAMAEKLMGKKSKAQFKVAGYEANCNDARSAAKRALAVAYLTIPPNSIIVGIDRDKGQVLIHEMQPAPIPLIAKKLGIQG